MERRRVGSYEQRIRTVILAITLIETLGMLIAWPDVHVGFFPFELFASGAIFGISRWIIADREESLNNTHMFVLIFAVAATVWYRTTPYSPMYRWINYSRMLFAFLGINNSAKQYTNMGYADLPPAPPDDAEQKNK